jgi:hypothetical protein
MLEGLACGAAGVPREGEAAAKVQQTTGKHEFESSAACDSAAKRARGEGAAAEFDEGEEAVLGASAVADADAQAEAEAEEEAEASASVYSV